MNFEDLTSLFIAQGFDYLETSQAASYLNDAYLVDICGDQDWPFLQETISSTAPLAIADLGSIEYVVNSTEGTKLTPLDPRNASDLEPNLSYPGVPAHYYITGGTTLNLFPTNTTDTIAVRYYRVPVALSGTATPVIPERFHSLIVDGAVARAYENSDDYELAQAAEQKFQTRLQRMREQLLNVYRDGPDDFVRVTDPLAF